MRIFGQRVVERIPRTVKNGPFFENCVEQAAEREKMEGALATH